TNENFLMKLNPCGEMEWCKIYDLNQYSIGGPVVIFNNGDFGVSSLVTINKDTIHNYYNSWIFRTDSRGNIKWQNFDNLNLSEKGLFLDKNENILATGNIYLPYPEISNNIFFIKCALNKTDSMGKRLWQSEYIRAKHIDANGYANIHTK